MLALYRAGRSSETIAEAMGLDPDDVERTIEHGWPERRGKHPRPALPSLSSLLADRIIRLRNAELDFVDKIVEAAARAARDRAETIKYAVQIERMIVVAWHTAAAQNVEDATKAGKAVDLKDLTAPTDALASLRTLRWLRDQGVDLRASELFKLLRGEDEDGASGSELDAIVSDLAELSKDEREEYARTGKIPKKQLSLPGT